MKYNRHGYKTEKCASIMASNASAAEAAAEKRDAINKGSAECGREMGECGQAKENSRQLKRQPLSRQAEKPNTKQTSLDSTRTTMGNGIEVPTQSQDQAQSSPYVPTHTYSIAPLG